MVPFLSSDDSLPAQMDILKCARFSATSTSLPTSLLPRLCPLQCLCVSTLNHIVVVVHGAKGPIFEDGPSFDMAFRAFHGRDRVVPLSERSSASTEKLDLEPAVAQFNNLLTAKAATISLSGFGGPFGFDFFSQKWKRQQRKSVSSRKDPSSQGKKISLKHEALGDEWLKTGNCPIAKSYQAVSNLLPLVAKVLQPPPGIHYRCPEAIVAARAAIARTALAKNLRPQPLPAKVLAIGLLGMAVNVPLGIWREHTKKFSPSWFAAVHAAVPFIAMLRKSVLMPKPAMAFTIGASIVGQVVGSRAERYRMKAAANNVEPVECSKVREVGTTKQLIYDPLTVVRVKIK